MTKTTYDIHQYYWLKKSKISPRFLELVVPSLQPTDVLVDIGCGNGRLAGALRPFVAKCIAIDFSWDLIASASGKYTMIDFKHGNAEDAKTWRDLPKPDVAVSNVAIRKDGCRIEHLMPHLRRCRQLFFRIQVQGDIPGWADTSPLYSAEEIGALLGAYFEVSIEVESYMQGFSDADYFRLFLQRINLTPNKAELDAAPAGRLYVPRSYALVSARRLR